MSEREKAFALFDTGLRPHQIYDQVKVKKHTLYWYFQEYKKLQEGIALEAEEIEEEILTELEAEEAEQRARQEAEALQREASNKIARQQQELKPLTDKLHSTEAIIRHFQWYPKNLPMHWMTFGNAYASPEEYLEALRIQRDALRKTIKEVKDRQAIQTFAQ